MPNAATLLIHAGQLIVDSADVRRRAGQDQGVLSVIEDGAVVIEGDRIAAVGSTPELLKRSGEWEVSDTIDAEGALVMPGFVDCHTHAFYAGERIDDFYVATLGRGTRRGIMQTVETLRGSATETLVSENAPRLVRMLDSGTTTIGVFSGYGLTVESELQTLRTLRRLNDEIAPEIVPLFMGAHATPAEFSGDPGGYLGLVAGEMLPAVRSECLSDFCDVFCRKGVFSAEELRSVLEKARQLGLQCSVHADEADYAGGAELAGQFGALNASQLERVSPQGIEALAEAGSVAVLLPGQTFCSLRSSYAPARALIDAGVPVAIASDFNPGSSQLSSMQLVISFAARVYRMSPEEIINAATINAAAALGLSDRLGSIAPGKIADLIVLDTDDYRFLPYQLGGDLIRTVIKGGIVAHSKEKTDHGTL